MPITSPYPRIDIPDIDLWDFLFERNDRPYADDKALFVDADTNRSYTYAGLRGVAIGFGQALRAQWDWQKGDVVAVYAPNSIDYPPILWGTHWAGGVVSTANPSYTPRELAFQLTDSGAKALVTDLANLGTSRKAAREAGLPEDRIILMGDKKDNTGLFKHFTSLRGFRQYSGAERPARPTSVDPVNDLSFLVYSSGTTGKPKGVMLTHTNIVSNILMMKAIQGPYLSYKDGPTGAGDKVIAFLPFFHSYGLTAVVHFAFYMGLESYVMPRFDLDKFCFIVQERKVTYVNVVPPVLLLLGKHESVDKYDLSSLRMLNSGAAPLTKELVDVVYKRLNTPIKQGYGLSETSPVTHEQRWDEWQKSVGSIGRLLCNQEAQIVSLDGEELPVGGVGEMWTRGPNVFKGYLNNPAGTKNALTADGWFKTGDVGYRDKDGFFYITDRIKELIKYNAYQVAPAELEGLLMSHPKIADVAVIGVQDDSLATEVPRAFVVPAVGVEPNEETAVDIMEWLRERVANHKRLRGGIRYIDTIPKTASGKILRGPLRIIAKQEGAHPKARL